MAGMTGLPTHMHWMAEMQQSPLAGSTLHILFLLEYTLSSPMSCVCNVILRYLQLCCVLKHMAGIPPAGSKLLCLLAHMHTTPVTKQRTTDHAQIMT